MAVRFDSPVSGSDFFFSGQVGPGGVLLAQGASAAGVAERTVVGTGAPASATVTTVGVGARGQTASSVTLTATAASVSGVGGQISSVSVELTVAAGRNLADQQGTVIGVVTDIEWEWYDDPDSSQGNPTDSGQVTTDASGETTIYVTNSALGPGQYGQVFLFHPSDPDIRATLRVPVT